MEPSGSDAVVVDAAMARWASFFGVYLLLPVSLLGGTQLFFNLQLEVVAGAAELHHQLAGLTGDLRQLFGAEEDQHQPKDENGVHEMHRAP